MRLSTKNKNLLIVLTSKLNVIMGLLTTVLLVNNLTREEYGGYAYVLTMLNFMSVLISWGFETKGLDILAKANNNEKLNIMNQIQSIRSILAIIVTAGAFLYIYEFSSEKNNLVILFLLLIYSTSIAYSSKIKLEAEEKYVESQLIMLGAKILNLISIVVIIHLGCKNFEYYVLILSISIGVQSLVQNSISGMQFKLPTKFEFDMMKQTNHAFVISLISAFPVTGSMLIISNRINLDEFGIFSLAFGMVKILQKIFEPMLQKFLVEINTHPEKKYIFKKCVRQIFLYSFISIATYFLVGEEFMALLFSKEKEAISHYINRIIFIIPFGLLSTLLANHVAVYLGQEKMVIFALIIISSMQIIYIYSIDTLQKNDLLNIFLFTEIGMTIMLVIMLAFGYTSNSKVVS